MASRFLRFSRKPVSVKVAFLTISVWSFLLGPLAFGQDSSKSSQISSRRNRVANPQVISKATEDATALSAPVVANRMTIERVHQLTGFKPASEAEVKQLIEKMETAAAENDAGLMRTCFDQDVLLSRVIAGVTIPEPSLVDLKKGFRAGNPAGEISKILSMRTTSHQLLHVRRTGDEYRPTFRTVSRVGGLAYSEFVIEADRGDGAKIVDIFFPAVGEYQSQMTRPLVIGGLLSKLNPDPIPSAQVDADIVAASEQLSVACLKVAIGNFSDGLAALDQCPQPIRHQPRILLIKCGFAKSLSVSEYTKYVEEAVQLYPGAPFTDLLRLEVARLSHQDADQMIIADRLLKTFPDSFLHCYRVRGLVQAGHMKDARVAMETAKNAAPTFADVHVADVELSMIEGDYARTIKVIEHVESAFGDDVLNLTSFEGFEAFSESPAGKTFLAKRAGFEF